MKRFGAACCLAMIGTAQAFASDLPTRKAGLWQIDTVVTSGHTVSMKQCTDAKTDQVMQSRSASLPQRSCSKHDVQKSADTITIDSVCTIAGRTTTSHNVITGSFDSAYTMVLTSEVKGIPTPRREYHNVSQMAWPVRRRSEARRYGPAQWQDGQHHRHGAHTRPRRPSAVGPQSRRQARDMSTG